MSDSIDMVKRVFTQESGGAETNKGEVHYNSLLEKAKQGLKASREQEPLKDIDMTDIVESEGVDRRDFTRWVSVATAILMLPPMSAPLVAEATELMNRVPVIWIELQDCAGNSKALLRSSAPTVDDLLPDVLSLEFHETLQAAVGHDADKQLEEAVEYFKGKYLLFAEGAIPMKMNGQHGTTGAMGETFHEHLMRMSRNATTAVAIGTCATFGGVPAAVPDPTGVVGVMDLVKGKPVINIPACPANPANMVGAVLHYILTGQVPELDSLLRPKFVFGYRIHDNCERRARFDAREFVEEWGDEDAENNWCLYKIGYKGPIAFNNCSVIRYNEGTNWPVGVGRGCIGCSEPDFWDRYAYERPMANAKIKAPTDGVKKTVGEFGLGLLTTTAVGIGAHVVASVITGKKSNEGEEK